MFLLFVTILSFFMAKLPMANWLCSENVCSSNVYSKDIHSKDAIAKVPRTVHSVRSAKCIGSQEGRS